MLIAKSKDACLSFSKCLWLMMILENVFTFRTTLLEILYDFLEIALQAESLFVPSAQNISLNHKADALLSKRF